MFKRYYTTQMSASKNQLKMRFVKIRSENGRYAKTFSRITAVILAICTIFATVVLASVDGYEHKNGTLTVNGKSLQVDIIHIDNIKYCNTDSYYIPLRKTFEALGYTVNYDVDKSTLPRRMTGLSEFPAYSYEGQEKLVTDSITQTDLRSYRPSQHKHACYTMHIVKRSRRILPDRKRIFIGLGAAGNYNGRYHVCADKSCCPVPNSKRRELR